jgi:hypothetical protein
MKTWHTGLRYGVILHVGRILLAWPLGPSAGGEFTMRSKSSANSLLWFASINATPDAIEGSNSGRRVRLDGVLRNNFEGREVRGMPSGVSEFELWRRRTEIGRRLCGLVSVKRAKELKNSQRRLQVLVKQNNFLCGYLTGSSVWWLQALPIKYLAEGLQATAWFHDPDSQKPRPGLLQTAAKPHISKQHTSNSYACKLIRQIQPLAIRSSRTKLTWGDFNSIHPIILNDAGCRTYELRSSHS